MFEDDLLSKTPDLVKGRLICPSGPGLGIDVDEKKLEKFSRKDGRAFLAA
jgi:L-alanine-DL-glutamate epimerase-like enolase superfamily enzyme